MDGPEVSTKLWYNETVGTTDEQHIIIPRGEIMGAESELVCVKDLPSRLCEVCNRWKMMMLSVVLSIGLVNKMTENINQELKTQTTNDMMKQAKGKEL